MQPHEHNIPNGIILVEDTVGNKSVESRKVWYAKQTWFNRLLIRWLKLDDVYEGAYCDGWLDCNDHSAKDLQDLVDAVEEIKEEGREISAMILIN